MPIITTIDFSTAAANTINNIAETVDVENVRFLVADSAGAKYVTLENINAGVTARISSHEGVTASTTDAGHVLLAESLSDARENVVATAAQVSEAIASAGGSSVNEEQLLHASVGLDSLAAGPGAVAYCADSVAVGLGAVVGATYDSQSKTATATRKSTEPESETNNTSGNYSSSSVAVGLHAEASSHHSTAYGNFATAGGYISYASGSYSMASGSYSTASGAHSKATGDLSTATGYYSMASGQESTAIGHYATATKYYSTAIGNGSDAIGEAAIAVGDNAEAACDFAIVIGESATVGNSGVSSVAIGGGAYVNDAGVVALNAGGGSYKSGVGYSTQLYVITKGSSLANTYLGGEAGLGYIVVDNLAGSIVARGVIPLASICTQHTNDFEPTGYAYIGDY